MYSPLSRQLLPDMIVALPVARMRDPVEHPGDDCAVIFAQSQWRTAGRPRQSILDLPPDRSPPHRRSSPTRCGVAVSQEFSKQMNADK
jgi:hypothetical protein